MQVLRLAARLEGPAQDRVPGRAAEAARRPRRAGRRQRSRPSINASTDSANLVLVGDVDMLERPALGAGAELPRPAPRQRVREQRRLRHQRARQSLGQRGPDRPAQPRDVLRGRSRRSTSCAATPTRSSARPRRSLQAELSDTERKLGELQAGAQRQELGADELRAAGRDPALPRRAGENPPAAARRAPRARSGHHQPRHDAQGDQHPRDAGGSDRFVALVAAARRRKAAR